MAMLMMVGILTGCGNDSSTGTNPANSENSTSTDAAETESQSTKVINLKMWIRASSKENNQTITIDEFNDSQDQIKVEYEIYGDNYSEVLKLALTSGEVPDVFEVAGLDAGSVRSFIKSGYMAPLDDYYDDEYAEQFNPSAFTQYADDGHVYIIPKEMRYQRLYYNKTLFERSGLDPDTPPSTLEEMMEFSKIITEAGEGEFYGFGLPIKSDSTWERNVDNIAILSATTGPWAFNYTTGQFDFAKQKPILEYFREMFNAGVIMPGSESLDIEMIRANFATDKIGMYIDGNWMVNGYNNELEAAKELNYDTALIPVFEGQRRAKDYLSLDSGHAIYANSEYKDEAFAVIKYVLDNVYEAPARKDPTSIAPSLSLNLANNERINAQEAVQNMKGVTGLLQGQNELASFPVIPSQMLTLEGDSRESVYPMLIIGNIDMDSELQKLSDTYNKALEVAIAEGTLSQSDLTPDGFDYMTR